MRRIICECGKKMYVFRNQNIRNIKIQYCPNCKITKIAHNKKIDEYGEKIEIENEL
jgi:hypothetical protein